jgi:hypothetical protein
MGLLETVRNIQARFYLEWYATAVSTETKLRVLSMNNLLETVRNIQARFYLEWYATAVSTETKLRVLSMNVWGIPSFPVRTAIGHMHLRHMNYKLRRFRNCGIVARTKAATKGGLDRYHNFHPAIGFPVPVGHASFETGLLVISKYNLSAAVYHPFLISVHPYALHETD